MKKTERKGGLHNRLANRLGIRSTIIVYLTAFVAFLVLLLWLFQVVLLQDFYRIYKSGQIRRTAETLVQNVNNDALSDLAEQLSEENDVCILLLKEDGQRVVSADSIRNCLIHRLSDRELMRWIRRAQGAEKPIMQVFSARTQPGKRFEAERFQGNFRPSSQDTLTFLYVSAVNFSDGTTGTLLLNTRISPVTSTVQTIRFQLVTITVIVLLAAFGLAFLISRSVSRPIIETNAAARFLSQGQYEKPKHSDSYREIAELNKTLTEAAAELNRVDELQNELIANVSHDLRTPLTMIGGYAEVMRDLPDETTPENLQIIIDETARLTSLVNELLDFSRLQAGKGELTISPFDLTASVNSIMNRIAKLTEKDGYSILFEPEESFFVSGDENRIAQVIYNLIGNALTYTGADKQVKITQRICHDRVRISISDTGKGIPAEELPLIWKRYYRTKESHRRAVVGSGLGLNIVRTILQKHQAPYGVDSQVGEGTTFWFELPLILSDQEEKEV